MEHDLATVGVENNDKPTHRGIGHFVLKLGPALFQSGDLAIQISDLKGHDCAFDGHGVIGVRGAKSEGRIAQVVFEPHATEFVRHLQAKHAFVKAARGLNVFCWVSDKGNGLDHSSPGFSIHFTGSSFPEDPAFLRNGARAL